MLSQPIRSFPPLPRYRIGQPLFTGSVVLPAGLYYRYQNHEHLMMRVLQDAISMATRAHLLWDPLHLAFTLQNGILFFLCRFFQEPWQMFPYVWHFVPEAERSLPKEIEKPDGSSELQLLLIDQQLGCVQGIRTVALPAYFTIPLHAAIEQQAHLPFLGIDAYKAALAYVQEQYPNLEDLVALSPVSFVDHPPSPEWRKPADEPPILIEPQANEQDL